MNIINILEEIEKVDGEIYERLSPRRKAMQDFFNVGKKISLAALPLALGSMFQKAYGQTTPTSVNDVLNFALTLEYLEYNFYDHSVKTSGLIPSGNALTAITTIRDHEKAHVDLLAGVLGSNARKPLVFTDFDFTAGGGFADVFSNYSTFLKVATAFEDTGVRAYKGQATNLKSAPAVLKTALQIHSVEARHAAHIRQMTAAQLSVPLKPWIAYADNGNDTGISAVDAIYAGEQNTTQAGIQIEGINSTKVSKSQAAESFDEVLTAAQVKAIANLFLTSPNKLS